jgi:hypothetical protein
MKVFGLYAKLKGNRFEVLQDFKKNIKSSASEKSRKTK